VIERPINCKVDAETGKEVDSSDIIKGYEVGNGQCIEIELPVSQCSTARSVRNLLPTRPLSIRRRKFIR
jgi:hypothetical protein